MVNPTLHILILCKKCTVAQGTCSEIAQLLSKNISSKGILLSLVAAQL